jgi:hypothetical protein
VNEPRESGAAGSGQDVEADEARDRQAVGAARMTAEGEILAVDQKGKVFKCLQVNCWHCFAKCPRRL